jgi:trimeric autotransporter adhesin
MRNEARQYVIGFSALLVAGIAVAKDVTLTLDPAADSAFVIQDSQSNMLTTIWADGRVVAGGGGYDSVTSTTLVNAAIAPFSTVSGGLGNLVDSNAWYGTVGGGYYNGAYGLGAAVGGGVYNSALGAYGTVPGGVDSHASGDYSFAAGRGAVANHSGTFVWADDTPAYIASTADNQFVVRASGGARFYSDTNATVGVRLAPGGTGWSGVSDRNLKENFTPVDNESLLTALNTIPMTTWNMKSQDDSIRHIGPMAQDFHAAFGVGEDNTHISYSDANGVSLAAIQGLFQLLQEQGAENRELRLAIERLEQRLSAIEAETNGASSLSDFDKQTPVVEYTVETDDNAY